MINKIKPVQYVRRKWMIILLVILVLSAISIGLCDFRIRQFSEGKLFDSPNGLPHYNAALVLGTSKYLQDGQVNLYYEYRINAAAALYKAGRVNYLVLSGDNSLAEYNEPEMMRNDLIVQGVDSTRIFLDYAGFRTLDSVVRMKEIFGQDSMIMVSQAFHNERAIYIAHLNHLKAVGFNAEEVSGRYGIKVTIREAFAKVKVFLDHYLGVEPKFLGEKIELK